jgi:hypothetical protein
MILLKFVRLSYNNRIRKIEFRPRVPLADTTTTRQVKFLFDDDDHEMLDVDGAQFAAVYHEASNYLGGGRWLGEFDSPE